MTITTTTVSQTFAGNGATTVFTFTFVAGQASWISVTYINASGVSTLLNPSQYTLVINSPPTGEIWGIGGTVTYAPGGSPIASNTQLIVARTVPYTQTTDIENQAFLPQSIEMAIDEVVMQTQQIANQFANGLPALPESPDTFLAGPAGGTTSGLPSFRAITSSDLPIGISIGTTGSFAYYSANGTSITGSTTATTTTVALLNVNQLWTAGQAITPTLMGTQSAGGTMTLNFALSNNFFADFGAGNLTIANPTSPSVGQCGYLVLRQDPTGSRTVSSWGSEWKWAGGTPPSLSTAGSASDLIAWCVVENPVTAVVAIAGLLWIKGYQ